jgi:CRISPR-associated protein Cas1
MLERIIEISETAAMLRVENHLLAISRPGAERHTVPLNEVAVLLLSNPAAMLSHAVLAQLAQNGAMVVCCDDKHLPAGMLLPLRSNFSQTRRMARQTEISLPTQKRLWRQIVRQKIKNQGDLLRFFFADDANLNKLAEEVKSGDPENMEGRAARIYWQKLGVVERRTRRGEDANRLLNYGYSVLLAACARSICAAGLHPSFGLHHHNGYNPFCLASDLMEPFRPLIDFAVCRLVGQGAGETLSRDAKRTLIGAIVNGELKVGGQRETVVNGIQKLADSLGNVFSGDRHDLALPQLLFATSKT